MLGNVGRDTRPELAVRRILHARGLRYRVDHRPTYTINSRADIVFTKIRLAVYIDGCFWHGCPEHYRPAKRNGAFWAAKFDENRRRDERTSAGLRACGWTVLRFWEHEPAIDVAKTIGETVHMLRA